MKSSLSIWRLLDSVKSTMKISSNFVAFLENMNFTTQRLKPWVLKSLGIQKSGVEALSWS